ncbi:MAG: class I fructose-bisphosphate aldolase [Gammaproteobacteria bacterium]
MNFNSLNEIALAMVAPGKGILAADESTGTIGKRFQTMNTDSTEESRRAYRDLLFSAPGMDEFISGVIMYDETLRQSTAGGVPFPKHLADLGVIPGIKVDKGAKSLAGYDGETITEGLDGLRERLDEYRELGALFAKWRAVIKIADNMPSTSCISTNAHALARYAALCQEAGIVPIVEPEVLMDGDHDIDACEEITSDVLNAVFNELYLQGVELEGMILKPNMIISATNCPEQASQQEVAEATVRCLKHFVPASVPGIAFLSGGQSAEIATQHLNLINNLGSLPWALSFSYGRALQQPVLQAWGGKAENVEAAMKALYHRARCNSAARDGKYSTEMEQAA